MNKIFDVVFKFTKFKCIDSMSLIDPFYKFIRVIDEGALENNIEVYHVKIICYFWNKLSNFDDIYKVYGIIYFIYLHVVNDEYDLCTHKLFGYNTMESRHFTQKFLELNNDYFSELFKINNDKNIIETFWNNIK